LRARRPGLLLLLLCCAFAALAQTPGYKTIPPEYELESLPLNSKKSLGILNDAIEDNEGFLWLSGSRGICAYDGRNLLLYSNQNSLYPLKTDSSKENFAWIFKGPDGLLYVHGKTAGNILCFDPAKRKVVYELKPDKQNRSPIRLSISEQQEIIVLDADNNAGKFTLSKLKDKQNRQPIYTGDLKAAGSGMFLSYTRGKHWLVHGRFVMGISADGSRLTQYSFPDEDTTPYINRVYQTPDAIYFFVAKTGKIYTWDKAKDRMVLYLALPQSLHIKSAFRLAIRNGVVLMANNSRMYLINSRDKTVQDLSAFYIDLRRKSDRSIQSEELNKILCSSDGNVYLIRQRSVYRLKKRMLDLEHFTEKVKAGDTFLLASFRSLTEDRRQHIYASYYNGIAVKAPGDSLFKPLPIVDRLGPKIPSTYNILYYGDHLFWNSVDIDLATGKHKFILSEQLSGHTTQYLSGDTLWLYPWLSRKLYAYSLKSRNLDSVNLDKRIGRRTEGLESINYITGEAGSSNLWLATQYDGIVLIDRGGKLQKQYMPAQLGLDDEESNAINTLYRNAAGLWFGCSYGLGLLHVSTGQTVVYNNSFSNGGGNVLNRTVFSILPDTAGNFYLGTSRGITYFNTQKKQFFNLPENHPLNKIEFNRASVLRASDGRYYFGSIDGLYSFMPSELQFLSSSATIKPVKLCNVIIYNSEQKRYRHLGPIPGGNKGLNLSAADNNIEFQFAVPEFNRNVFYSYRILGQGGEWSEYSAEGKVLVYNLQPGNYMLEVKASTDQSDNNARLYRLTLTVEEVWYKRVWVVVLFLLGAVAAVFLAIYYRLNQKLKRQKALTALRSKISMDLHDDVGSVLSGLAMQSELLTYTAPEEHQPAFKEISILSREAMERMRDIVWSMDHRKDKYENLVDRMRAYAERNLSGSNIRYDFITEGIPTGKFINPEKRQTIYLIFKEALANILKHSDARHVLIRFTEDKGSLQLVVQDNGSKMVETVTDGMGLSNIRERARRIGGTLTAEYDQGFRVTLYIG
jgi:signal transduction histidine kinase/sugar lactone lactonase YvrE